MVSSRVSTYVSLAYVDSISRDIWSIDLQLWMDETRWLFSLGQSIQRRLPASAGDSARALRILYVCVVRHVKIFTFV